MPLLKLGLNINQSMFSSVYQRPTHFFKTIFIQESTNHFYENATFTVSFKLKVIQLFCSNYFIVIYKKNLIYVIQRTVDFYYNFYIDVICFTAERNKRSLPPGKNQSIFVYEMHQLFNGQCACLEDVLTSIRSNQRLIHWYMLLLS